MSRKQCVPYTDPMSIARWSATSGHQFCHHGKWHFVRLEPSGTIYAKEPSGAEHVVKNGDMNSVAGIELLNAMTKDLT